MHTDEWECELDDLKKQEQVLISGGIRVRANAQIYCWAGL